MCVRRVLLSFFFGSACASSVPVAHFALASSRCGVTCADIWFVCSACVMTVVFSFVRIFIWCAFFLFIFLDSCCCVRDVGSDADGEMYSAKGRGDTLLCLC